jgi:hypothetical protein
MHIVDPPNSPADASGNSYHIVERLRFRLSSLLHCAEQTSRDFQAMSRLMPVALEFYAVALRQRSIRKHLASMYDELLSIFVPLMRKVCGTANWR